MSPFTSIALQHVVAAPERRGRVAERVVARRRLRQAGEERRLLERQLLRRAREVRLGGGLDPVGVIAVEHLVHVRGQDPVLRPLARQLDREARLGELALERPLAREVEVPHELLRDRRAALDDLAGADVRDDGARDADGIDAAVLVEAPVLDRDGRLRHPRADLAARHRRAVALRGDDAELRAVRRVDERVLADGDRAQRVEVAARAEHRGRADRAARRRRRPAGRRAPRAEACGASAACARARAACGGGGSRRAARRSAGGRAAGGRRHPQTPSARRRPCARTRSSRSSSLRGVLVGARSANRHGGIAVERAHVDRAHRARPRPLREARRPLRRDRLKAEPAR